MQVEMYRDLTNEQIEKLTDVLTEAFRRNKFIYSYLMGENPRILKKFMKMVVKYNNHFADYYALVKDDGELAAVVIYLPAGCEPMGLHSALRRRRLLDVVQFFLAQPAKFRKRTLKFSDLEDKHWPKEPSITLDVLASLEKGCGKALVKETIKNYHGQTIALNSSVDQNAHAYYTQFGFKTYAELQMDDYKTVMMIRTP